MLRTAYAFTLAEVLIVLTILGIIAAISMTTLRPTEFKQKGLAIAAKKVMYDIDVATTEILLDKSTTGSEAQIPAVDCTSATLATLYKAKLSATRKDATGCAGGGDTLFYLKSGACIGIATATNAITRFPDETSDVYANPTCALIYFDTNGTEGPNTIGSDRFVIPLDNNGISYDGASNSSGTSGGSSNSTTGGSSNNSTIGKSGCTLGSACGWCNNDTHCTYGEYDEGIIVENNDFGECAVNNRATGANSSDACKNFCNGLAYHIDVPYCYCCN